VAKNAHPTPVFYANDQPPQTTKKRTSTMARKPRFCPAEIAQHVIQRGNNRQVCFAAEMDFAAYANWLLEYSVKFDVQIHAWVFMTNHVHLLVTPQSDDGVSLMMQSVGRRYVQYFNRTYKRSGTLWEGRFKSCLVQTERYVLECYRYIELNPVRASMVNDPAEYRWSSYSTNALGADAKICCPHQEYLQLGRTAEERRRNYRTLFSTQIDGKLVEDLRFATQKGLVLGTERFKDEVEVLFGRKMRVGVAGRPLRAMQ